MQLTFRIFIHKFGASEMHHLNRSSLEEYDKFEEENNEFGSLDRADQIIQTHINDDGTTSNYFDKRKLKIAPRSTLQFKVGPPFELVDNYSTVFETSTSEPILFQLNPRIDRGFDFIDDEWVGYKRNYFTLVSSFETPGLELDAFLNGSYSIQLHNTNAIPDVKIKYFAVKIKAKSDDDQTEISLVQHTAKRDKGPQFTPATTPLIPSELPQHQIIREASNVRNFDKMRKYDSTFFFHRDRNPEEYDVNGIVSSYPIECIQKVARYERVQFASSINVKKPSQQNKHFRLHIILGAVTSPPSDLSPYAAYNSSLNMCDEEVLEDGTREYFVPLQEMQTPPLIIRGRSPSNYTSSQRIAVRTNSSLSLGKKSSASPNNPILTSQQPVSSPISSSPLKKKVGRPAKRGAKVSEPTSVPPSVVKTNIKEAGYRASRRVETIEHIERLYKEGSSIGLRKSDSTDRYSNENVEDESKRPRLSRNSSIDPREIELKPSSFEPDENVYIVGSLALTATLKSQRVEKSVKRRKTDEQSTSKMPELQAAIKANQASLLSPRSLSSHSATKSPDPQSPIDETQIEQSFEDSLSNGLHSISLSMLNETSSNYCHVTTTAHSEEENIPRTFTRIIGETSFTNLYTYKQEVRIPESISTKDVNNLPSQVEDGNFYEELSFYRH